MKIDKKNRPTYKERIYVASFALDCIETMSKLDFGMEINHTCISNNLNKENWDKTKEWILKDLYDAGCSPERTIVHGPFTEISPCSIDSRALELTYERTLEAAEMAREIGSSKLVFHTGYFPTLYYPQWHKEKSVEFWKKIDNDLDQDLEVYIENVFEEDPILLKEIIDEVGSPRINCCIDVGHITAMGSTSWPTEKWIEYLGPLIKHFHLHNNKGEKKDLHDDFFHGNMDPESVMMAIDTYCKDATLTIESKEAMATGKWLDEYFSKKK